MSVPPSTAEVLAASFIVSPVPPGTHLPRILTASFLISPVPHVGQPFPTSLPSVSMTKDLPANIDLETSPNDISPTSEPWNIATIPHLLQALSFDQAVIRAGSDEKDEKNDLIISPLKFPGIAWLENPGTTTQTDLWNAHPIAISSTPCFVKAGHFSRRDTLQIVAFPIATPAESPPSFTVYTKPDDLRQNWGSVLPVTIAATPRDVFVIPGPSSSSCPCPSADQSVPFDQIILASQVGIDAHWYGWDSTKKDENNEEENKQPSWQTFRVGSGPNVGFVSVGRVGDDYAGYICSSENSSVVCVHVKDPGSGVGIVNRKWTRQVLHDFSTSGSICQVICADINCDGVDEILVAVAGSESSDVRGVWAYTLIDQKTGKFEMRRLCSILSPSTSSCPPGPFSQPTDFAASRPLVPAGRSPDQSLPAYLQVPTGIIVERLGGEVLFKVVSPQYVEAPTVMPFLDVNGYRFSIAVLPPNMSIPSTFKADGVKVLAGSYVVHQQAGTPLVKTRATRPTQTESLLVNPPPLGSSSPDTSGGMGCIFFLVENPPASSVQAPATSPAVSKPTSKNIFPSDAPADVQALEFPWVAVTDHPDGTNFLHIAGFHVHEASDTFTRIGRIEFFATSEGVLSGFTNHRDESASHIRACIVNSTGTAGMRFATVTDGNFDPDNPDLDKTKLVPMDAFTEHGALWRTTRDGLPRLRSNATIDYPWNSWVAGAPSNDSSLPARDNSSHAGDGSAPTFDIFATFSFPPFMTFGRPQADIPDGTYIIRFVPPGGSTGNKTFLALESQGPNPAVDPLAVTVDSPKDQWKISRVPGTDMYAIRHVVTSRLLGSKWPVKVNQNMIGARTPDQLGFTTRFAAIRDPQGNVNFRITSQSDLEEDLFLTSSLTTDASTSRIPVVLQFKGFDTPAWSLESSSSV